MHSQFNCDDYEWVYGSLKCRGELLSCKTFAEKADFGCFFKERQVLIGLTDKKDTVTPLEKDKQNATDSHSYFFPVLSFLGTSPSGL